MNPKRAIEKYIVQFLEERHPQFSNMPPCPFASKERLEDRIVYKEVHIGKERPTDKLIEEIRIFDSNPHKSTMIIYDTHQLCSLQEAYEFAQHLIDLLMDLDILPIPLHPEDPFAIGGVRTRQTPFMMMTIQRKSLIFDAKKKLLSTTYYSLWDDVEERYLDRFEEYMQKEHQDVFFTRLWWRDEFLNSILRGVAKPKIVVGVTVGSLSRNEFHLWINRWGVLHGWHPLCAMKYQNMNIVEEVVKDGGCVLATAHGGGEPGLLLVANDQDDRLSFFPELNREWLQRSWSGGSGFWFFLHDDQVILNNTSL
jgi:hypothetical protein